MQGVPLRDKVVLPAHAAEYAAVLQLIGHPGAKQGHGERAVHKARVAALQAFQCFLAVQLVDKADGGHVEFAAFAVRHLPQALVKTGRAEDEAAMHAHPVSVQALVKHARVGERLTFGVRVHLAPHDARVHQHHQPVYKHFTATVQALGEGHDAALCFDQGVPGADVQVVEQGAIACVVGLTCQ